MNEENILKIVSIVIALLLVGLIIWLIIRQVEKYKTQSDPKIVQLRGIFNSFFNQKDKKWTGHLESLNRRNIPKETRLYRTDTSQSHTMNKEEIFMCLKNEKGEYYPLNMLIYVLAHEYTHVIDPSVWKPGDPGEQGHTKQFWSTFDELLEELTKAGIYDPTQPFIANYCEHKN